MADDDRDQKTEQPTQRRLDKAHEQGDVVKSAEVSAFVLLAGGTLSIAMFGSSLAEGFTRDFRVFLEQPDQLATDPGGLMNLFSGILWHGVILVAPVFAVMIAAALAGNLLQHRPVFSAARLMPDLAKLSPLKGLKRIFGLDGITNLVKGFLKIGLVGAALWTQIWPMRGMLEGVMTQDPVTILSGMMTLLMHMLIAALSVLAAIAAADYFLQRFRFIQRNKMSRQEIKEEFRQSEGDPAIKAKIKQIRTDRARKRMMAAVPEATVVITNPTHYAIALKYESGKMAAPVCVAKGVDALALRIRELAEEHDVPIVENPPLARALYATVELDDPVPPEHYKAVAQVIGYVMRLTGKIRAN